MITKEFYAERTDGVQLYRTYSDAGLVIRQVQTGAEYSEAVDVEDSGYTYEETDKPIEPRNDEGADVTEALNTKEGM